MGMIRGVGVRRRARAGSYRAPRGRVVRELPAWAGELGARAPLAAFLLLLLWSPVSRDDGVRAAALALLWAIAYALAFVLLIAGRSRMVKLLPIALPTLAVVALALISPMWSDTPDFALRRAVIVFATTACAYAVVCRFKLAEFLESLVLASGVAAVLSLLTVVFKPSRGIMQYEYAGAWQGIFPEKNTLGEAMALGAATMIALALARGISRRRRLVLWASAALCCLLMLGSESVTSIAMFVTMTATLLLFALARVPNGARWTALVVGLAASAITVVRLNANELLDSFGRDATLTGRTDIWSLVIECISRRPWLGYGYNSFWRVEGGSPYLPPGLEFAPYHAHNGVLQLALDIGLVGVALFGIALVAALWRAGRFAIGGRDIVAVWPLAALVYFISGSFTEANIAQYYSRMNWVVFVVAALYAYVRRPQPDASDGRFGRAKPAGGYVAPRGRSRRLPNLVAPRRSGAVVRLPRRPAPNR